MWTCGSSTSAPTPAATPAPASTTATTATITTATPATAHGEATTATALPTHQPGRFSAHSFRHLAGSLADKLYGPAGVPAAPRAMVVMLHGCTQSAGDFTAGTRMNQLADLHDLLVVYPEQAAQANRARCWNWFQPQDQRREGGEPAVIAGIVRQVAQQQGADPRRIFVAGLSAGAAMAVALGQTHSDLFAGVGAHSGLAHGSAHDIPSALAAMKGGRSGLPGQQRLHRAPGLPRDQAVQAHANQAGGAALHATTHQGLAPGGRRFSCTVHADAVGQTRIAHWTVQGAGHAWSGGDPGGSHTDGAGPDASAEMLRFFLALPA